MRVYTRWDWLCFALGVDLYVGGFFRWFTVQLLFLSIVFEWRVES